MAVPNTSSDGLFTLRRAFPEDIPHLRNLLTDFFESGEFGRDLSFGELEMQDYLDWFLPKTIVDTVNILYVLQYLPKSSSRTYEAKIIGCCYIALSDSSSAPKLGYSLGVLKLHAVNAWSDVQVWPNRQAAEVHRRFQRAREARVEMQPRQGINDAKAHVLFAAIQKKYRGVGSGTRMMAWAKEAMETMGVETIFHVGSPDEAVFMQQCKIQAIVMPQTNVVKTP